MIWMVYVFIKKIITIQNVQLHVNIYWKDRKELIGIVILFQKRFINIQK